MGRKEKGGGTGETYKPPSPKTIISAMRWRLGRWSCLSTGRGRTPMAMSVAMFMPALANLRGIPHQPV